MMHFFNLLWFVAFVFMIGEKGSAYSLAVSNSSEEYGYYNIYNKIDSMQKAFQTLETNVQRKNNMLRQILQPITEMDDNIKMSDQSSQVTKTVQPLQKNDTFVGFTTKLPTTTYSSTSSNIRGRENSILYNGGNAYNGTVFTCPSPGLYLFHVSMLTNTKSGGIWIYKNSQQLTLAFAGSDPQWNGASVSAATWLDVGDQVYLRPYSSTLYIDGNSAFTGVKIN
uniref:Uncharacterized protein LOC111105386 n=1 Tax=Crassostrea virginica TaxID=6565 RepID=A0A8B8AW10_CRAVI|nr:uncharacterized protein LOC111105386 [Crassostrea virginica]